MTISEFSVLCGKYNIEPSIALENEKLKQRLRLLKLGDDILNTRQLEIEKILKEEF